MANYPTSLPSTTPADHTAVNDEIVAIATELGLSPSGSYATVLARLDDYLGRKQLWGPEQQGFLAWNADPFFSTNSVILSNAGTLWVFRLWTATAITVTNVHFHVVTAGATLTASQNLAALYDSSGTLLSTTGDQSTAWTSTGLKTMVLGSAQAVAAGFFDVAWFWNGTTAPVLLRMNNNAAGANMNLTGNSMRSAITNNTGLTTSMPATLGTKTAHANGYWVGVS